MKDCANNQSTTRSKGTDITATMKVPASVFYKLINTHLTMIMITKVMETTLLLWAKHGVVKVRGCLVRVRVMIASVNLTIAGEEKMQH